MPQNGSGRLWTPTFQTGATKMALQDNFSNFFYPKSTKIYEKIYVDPIQITFPRSDHHMVNFTLAWRATIFLGDFYYDFDYFLGKFL